MEKTTDIFWDPVGEAVTLRTFEKDNEKLQKQLADLQADPDKLRRNKRYLWMVAIIGSLLMLYPIYLILVKYPVSIKSTGSFILPFIPLMLYTAYIRTLQNDLVSSLFAKTHGWVYNPGQSAGHWKLLANAFPSLFALGHGQFVDDEFWGSLHIDGISYQFWKANFTYIIGSGKSQQTHKVNTIAFQLPRAMKADLVIAPEGLDLFGAGRDDIQTESVEFNKKFSIICPNMDENAKQNIIRALSPAVLTMLLDLKTKKGAFAMELKNDVIIFTFTVYQYLLHHTNFFKKVAIDPRDTEALQQDIRDMVAVIGELLRFID